MSYYPKTIKKDPLYNWKGVEKYRDENSGKLPAQEARGTKKIPTLDNIIKVNQNPEKGYCACGKKLHYDGEVSKEYYTKLFERVGQFIEIEGKGEMKNTERTKQQRINDLTWDLVDEIIGENVEEDLESCLIYALLSIRNLSGFHEERRNERRTENEYR